MTAWQSKEYNLTPALKENRRTTEQHLQWQADNGHKNILFTEKFFTIKQYSHQKKE
jgi:hypothetical protein